MGGGNEGESFPFHCGQICHAQFRQPAQLSGIFPALGVFFDIETPDPMDIVPEDLRDVIEFYQTVSAYERGEALFLMPYTLDELDLDNRD